MSSGLVLEGGGLRGIFTAGVLDVFLENNIEFDSVIGVSAGACHACSYLSKQYGRARDTAIDYIDDSRYCSVKSLIKTGNLFGEQFIYHEIPDKLYPIDNEAFLRGNTTFQAVVTDCMSGKAEYPYIRDLKKDIDWILASSSLPLLAKTVKINSREYLDGGLSDSVPIKQSQKQGNDRNVIVLTRDRAYRKEPEKLYSVIEMKYKRYPGLLYAIKHRHEMYNETLDYIKELEAGEKTVVVAPKYALNIGRTEKNREKLMAGYEEGRKAALEKLEDIKRLLNNRL